MKNLYGLYNPAGVLVDVSSLKRYAWEGAYFRQTRLFRADYAWPVRGADAKTPFVKELHSRGWRVIKVRVLPRFLYAR